MRGKLFTLLLAVLLLQVFVWNVSAQEEGAKSKDKLYVIHEDIVKPSKVAEYEKAAKGFAEALAKADMHNLKNLVIQTDDMVYSYVSEVENMASLDERPFKELKEKMGEEAFDAMFDAYNGTFESHRNFMVRLRDDLSYTPEQSEESTEEMNFRHWDFVHYFPDKGDEAKEISKEWVELYKSKKSPMGYRTYTGGLGTDTPFYVYVAWAKDAQDFHAQNDKNRELLGDEGKDLWQRTLAITRKFEHKNGRIRPDLSYLPEEEELTAK